MNEIKITITEQLRQLQMLMHRASIHDFAGNGKIRSPLRGQGRVLSMLKIKPEISQRDLTYLLGMSKQSIAELLSKLEKSHYIIREQSQDDKRIMTVKLTEEGQKAAEDIDTSASDATDFLDCLNAEELTAFSQYLKRIIKCCEERFPDLDLDERHRAMEAFMSRRGPMHEFHEHANGHGFDRRPDVHRRRPSEGESSGRRRNPFPHSEND